MWEKRIIKKPSEVLSVGDKVKVKVTAIKDGKTQSSSIKEASDMMAKEIEEALYEVPGCRRTGNHFTGLSFF